MWFNIVMANHGSDPSALPFLFNQLPAYMRNALWECGHQVTFSWSEVEPKAINLFFELFMDGEYFASLFRDLRRNHGIKIGIIVTELMIRDTFPYHRHGLSSDPVVNDLRMAGFMKVMEEVDFLWCFLERTANDYRPRLPLVEFLPIACLERPAGWRAPPKDHDLLFFGRVTPHRQTILEQIEDRGFQVTAMGLGTPRGWLPDFMAQSFIDRARIGLNLTLHGEHENDHGIDPRFVSGIRVSEMLSRDICVVSEEIPHDNPYQPYMLSAREEDLPALCQELLMGGQWQGWAAEAGERFRQDMSARRVVAPVVDRTLDRLFAAG